MAEQNYIEEFISAIKPAEKKTNTTYSAVVSRVDNIGTVWVRLSGSNVETPTASTSSEIEPNDDVTVEWRNNKLYIVGNTSNPSAGSIRVTAAEQAANQARTAAQSALQDAGIARQAAEQAQADAGVAKSSAESASRSATSALTQLGVVEEVVDTINWLAEHGQYSITDDVFAQSDKLYYKRLYIYEKTEDSSIDPTKTYYTRSGSGTDEDPYVYTEVENPVAADIGNYYEYIATNSYSVYDVPEDGNPHELGLYQLDGVDEAVTNYIASHIALTDSGLWVTADESGYKILISSDGIRLYSPEGVISTFGENIEFNSSTSQRIGGDNEYIEFDHATGKLNIVADSVSIGNRDAGTAFDSIENTLSPMQDQLDNQSEALRDQQETLNNLTGYVEINTEESYIRVGKRNADSYVQIDGSDTKVAININGKDVAYMNGDRFYAPSAVVTNLYMKTEDNTVGTIGWVMRSNGHLSLKRLK